VLTALVVYVGSHLALSRYSAAQFRKANVECFMYVPCDPTSLRDHRGYWHLHYILVFMYAPAWAVDHYIFGGPPPMMSEPLYSLSPEADPARSNGE
jgi:hypothetical protein